MKRLTGVLVVLLLSVMVTACGGGGGDGGGGGGTPADAAKGFIDGFAAQNAETMRSFLCSAQSSGADELAAGFSALGSDVKLDAAGVTYTVTNETADSATVKLGGTMKMEAAGVSTDQPVDGMFDEGLPMTKENGAWKVCPPLAATG